MKEWKKNLLLCVLLALTACNGGTDFEDLNVQMEAIKRKPRGSVEPPPPFKTYENFVYSASLLRSPFQPPVEVEPVKIAPKGRKVRPDFRRPKEVLENFSLDSLVMVGSIKKAEQQIGRTTLYALIRDNKSGIHRVRVGNYIGKNHGKILSVTTGQLDVMELIPDGQQGWVERPRTLVLKAEG